MSLRSGKMELERELPPPMIRNRPLNFLIPLLLTPFFVHASDWRVGASIGYGGAGLTQTQDVAGTKTSISKAEGPGMFNLYAERLISDRWAVGLESEVGFRLGPFSAGESFNGISGRWYWGGGQPA